MNLAEALDVLPELTTVTKIKRIFRVDPRLVGREQQRRPVTVTGHIVLPGERSAALYGTREKFLVKKIHGSLRQMFDNTG